MTAVRTLLLVSAVARVALSAWEPLGPFGASLGDVVAASPDDSLVYVSTWGGDAIIYRSTDRGTSWERAGTVPERVQCLAVDPQDRDRIYAGAAPDIFRSTDGGASWTRDSLGYWVSIFDVAVHPLSSVVYAVGEGLGTDAGMAFFRSTDNGESWIRSSPPGRGGGLFCVTIDPSDPSRVYVGGCLSDAGTRPCVFLTTDMGQSFAELERPGFDETQVKSLSIHPEDPAILCAGGLTGMYRSTDRGGSWSRVSDRGSCFGLATTSADPDFVAAATLSGVMTSSDGGATWDSCAGPVGRFFRGVVAGRADAVLLYTVNGLGFFRSTDQGETWAESNRGLDMFGRIAASGVAQSHPEVVFTAFSLGYPPIPVYRTTDRGSTWTTLETPMNCGNPCGVVVSPFDPLAVFCLEGTVT